MTKLIFRERNAIFLEIATCDPSIYRTDHPYLTVYNLMDNPIGLRRVKQSIYQEMAYI